MKGGAAPEPERNSRITGETEYRQPNIRQNILEALGFEEGELEMFFQTTNIPENQLVNRYLEIARNPPYNLNWGSVIVAARANYMTGVFKSNGIEYTKHDIAEDALSSFYDELQGGLIKKKRRTKRHYKKRGTKKISRRYRLRRRRNN